MASFPSLAIDRPPTHNTLKPHTPVVGRALVAHAVWEVGGKQPPLVAHAVRPCSLHKQPVLLLCPLALRLQQRSGTTEEVPQMSGRQGGRGDGSSSGSFGPAARVAPRGGSSSSPTPPSPPPHKTNLLLMRRNVAVEVGVRVLLELGV